VIVEKPNGNNDVLHGSTGADGYVMGHGVTKVAVLREEDIAAAEAFVLVDLSDTTNFPHTETGRIRVYSLSITAEKAGDGQFVLLIGVITEVDATDGSTKWFLVVDDEMVLNPTDSTDRIIVQFSWPNGLDLEVSAGAALNLISNDGHTGSVIWQTDVNLDSPVGATSSPPGAGDLVLYVEEPGGTGTISFTITVEYTTEAAS